jgi:hypothetical protein
MDAPMTVRIPRLAVTFMILPMLALSVAACDEEEDYSKRPDRIPSQGSWAQPLPNPVIKASDLRRQGLWNDPSPLKENGGYILYMTTSVAEPFKPPVLPFRAISSDGVNWRLDPDTPLLTAAGTQFVSIETPSVVKFNNEYHMFFDAIYATPPTRPKDYAIGHARSADGIHWTATPEPVITATGDMRDWNGFLVGEPGAIVYRNQIYVYFSAVGGPLQTIALAKTVDGEHFSTPVKVIDQLAPVYPRERGFAGYSTPSAFELNGDVHLLYDVVLVQKSGHPEWQQVALHHAVSRSGGEGDFVQDDNPIFTRNDFPWTMGEIDGPAALVDGGLVKMWFAGHVPHSSLGPLITHDYSGPEFAIGYATRCVSDFK